MRLLALVAALLPLAAATRDVYLLDFGWKFELGPANMCPVDVWPYDLSNQSCSGAIFGVYAVNSEEECKNACCKFPACEMYQYHNGGCSVGTMTGCHSSPGTIARGRNATAPPNPPAVCADPGCAPGTSDGSWRSVDLPHDFIVEGNFTPLYSDNATESHGFLPYGTAWYRKHLSIPDSAKGATIWVDFEAIQTTSTVYLNGHLLGYHAYGYTNSRYFIDSSIVNWGGADNVLAVFVDGSVPDSWWYDGGGIYRHVFLTVITTPGPFISPWGVYAPSNVTGAISWSGGLPSADATVSPSVEVWTNTTGPAQQFSVSLSVSDPTGKVVGTATGSGSVVAGTPTVWTPSSPIFLTQASLWHLVSPPASPALYKLTTTLTVAGTVVDDTTVTFGIRQTYFDAATGFYLNGVGTKIMGTANHQDAAAVGVAVPDHLQTWRVAKLKEMGVNGWRTAHNPPNPALLDAADSLGLLVWDETHRNGILSELEILIKRDRNHPSVIIWSLCNEVLCSTDNWVQDALTAKALIRQLDPLGGRPVSANQNGWIGVNTPLDLQGFDYTTSNYDAWHAEAPHIPSISSETSAATNDRGEYANNGKEGHCSGYDVNYPGFGELAEAAWGGIGVSNGQGILTRPFISGGWTWTGHDYRGEPTPYGWPDVNSHFGTVDLAGFPKDRFFYYKAWYIPTVPSLYLFPHWNWAPGAQVDVWVYSNLDAIELLVNGASQGIKNMTQFSHVEWDNVNYAPGSIQAIGYKFGSSVPVAVEFRNTTGPAASLQLSVKDGVGSSLVAGCQDIAYVQVEVVDSNGAVVPDANNNVTFSLNGAGVLAGTANGDPACLVNNKSPVRPAFHGLALAVVLVGDQPGLIKIQATSPGLAPSSLTLTVQPQPQGFQAYWCKNNDRL